MTTDRRECFAVDRVQTCDCVAGMADLPENSIQLIVADPPYNIGVKYDQHNDKMSAEHYLEWSRGWLNQCFRVLKENGSLWVFINDDYVSEIDVLAKSVGFIKRSHVVWHYTFGVSCTKKLSRSHTHILYYTLTNDVNVPIFNREAVLVPSMRQVEYGDKRASPKGKLPDDTWYINPKYIPEGFQPDSDTWAAPRVCGTFKERQGTPNQLPMAIVERIVRLASDPDSVVLDPFSGSFTTCCVAKKLGRHYIGFELSEAYTQAGIIRLENTKVGDELAGEQKKAV